VPGFAGQGVKMNMLLMGDGQTALQMAAFVGLNQDTFWRSIGANFDAQIFAFWLFVDPVRGDCSISRLGRRSRAEREIE